MQKKKAESQGIELFSEFVGFFENNKDGDQSQIISEDRYDYTINHDQERIQQVLLNL